MHPTIQNARPPHHTSRAEPTRKTCVLTFSNPYQFSLSSTVTLSVLGFLALIAYAWRQRGNGRRGGKSGGGL